MERYEVLLRVETYKTVIVEVENISQAIQKAKDSLQDNEDVQYVVNVQQIK